MASKKLRKEAVKAFKNIRDAGSLFNFYTETILLPGLDSLKDEDDKTAQEYIDYCNKLSALFSPIGLIIHDQVTALEKEAK